MDDLGKIDSKGMKRVKDRERYAAKRQDPSFRERENLKRLVFYADKRQNPSFRERENFKRREANAAKRQDPSFREHENLKRRMDYAAKKKSNADCLLTAVAEESPTSENRSEPVAAKSSVKLKCLHRVCTEICDKEQEALTSLFSCSSEELPGGSVNVAEVFRCQECDLSLNDVLYKAHRLEIHGDKKPFKCCCCSYSTITSYLLLRHARRHTVYEHGPEVRGNHQIVVSSHLQVPPVQNSYQCEMCMTRFPSKESLKSHIRHQHIEIPEREEAHVMSASDKMDSREKKKYNYRKRYAERSRDPTFLRMESLRKRLAYEAKKKCLADSSSTPQNAAALDSERACTEIPDKEQEELTSLFSCSPEELPRDSVNVAEVFRCQDCDLSLNDVLYKAHRLEIHGDKKPFKCCCCSYSTITSYLLLRHARRHTVYGHGPEVRGNHQIVVSSHLQVPPALNSYQCEMCVARFSSKESLKCHIRQQHIETPEREEAQVMSASDKMDSREKKKYNYRKRYAERSRDPTFLRMESLRKRLAYEAKKKCLADSSSTRQITVALGSERNCTEICDKEQEALTSLFSCSSEELPRDSVNVAEVFRCQECDLSFNDVLYKAHRLEIHGDKKPFKCCCCSYSTITSYLLLRHARRHTVYGHGPEVCGNHQIVVSSHLQVPPVLNSYQCEMCVARFSSKESLKCHIRQQHIETPEREEAHVMSASDRMDSREKKKYNSKKRYAERSRDPTFLRNESLRKRLAYEAKKKCLADSSSTPQKAAALDSERACTEIPDKEQEELTSLFSCSPEELPRDSVNVAEVFRCQECDLSFNDVLYKAHRLKIHGDIKPFKCCCCSYSTITSYLLLRHARRHTVYGHGPEVRGNHQIVVSSHLQVPPVLNSYQCEMCMTRFPTKEFLKSHIRHQHIETPEMQRSIILGRAKPHPERTSYEHISKSRNVDDEYLSSRFCNVAELNYTMNSGAVQYRTQSSSTEPGVPAITNSFSLAGNPESIAAKFDPIESIGLPVAYESVSLIQPIESVNIDTCKLTVLTHFEVPPDIQVLNDAIDSTASCLKSQLKVPELTLINRIPIKNESVDLLSDIQLISPPGAISEHLPPLKDANDIFATSLSSGTKSSSVRLECSTTPDRSDSIANSEPCLTAVAEPTEGSVKMEPMDSISCPLLSVEPSEVSVKRETEDVVENVSMDCQPFMTEFSFETVPKVEPDKEFNRNGYSSVTFQNATFPIEMETSGNPLSSLRSLRKSCRSQRGFVCELCSRVFHSKSALLEHAGSCEDCVCPFCSKRLVTPSSCKSHLKSCSARIDCVCPFCAKRLQSPELCKSHVTQCTANSSRLVVKAPIPKHSRAISRSCLPDVSSKVSRVKQETIDADYESSTLKAQLQPTDSGGVSFPSTDHQSDNGGIKFVCPYCSKEFDKPELMDMHVFTDKGFCKICKETLFCDVQLVRHMLNSHNCELTSMGQLSKRSILFHCLTCKRSYKRAVAFVHHAKQKACGLRSLEKDIASSSVTNTQSISNKSYSSTDGSATSSVRNFISVNETDANTPIVPEYNVSNGSMISTLATTTRNLNNDNFTPFDADVSSATTTEVIANTSRLSVSMDLSGFKNGPVDPIQSSSSATDTYKSELTGLINQMTNEYFAAAQEKETEPMEPVKCVFCSTYFEDYSLLQTHLLSVYSSCIWCGYQFCQQVAYFHKMCCINRPIDINRTKNQNNADSDIKARVPSEVNRELERIKREMRLVQRKRDALKRKYGQTTRDISKESNTYEEINKVHENIMRESFAKVDGSTKEAIASDKEKELTEASLSNEARPLDEVDIVDEALFDKDQPQHEEAKSSDKNAQVKEPNRLEEQAADTDVQEKVKTRRRRVRVNSSQKKKFNKLYKARKRQDPAYREWDNEQRRKRRQAEKFKEETQIRKEQLAAPKKRIVATIDEIAGISKKTELSVTEEPMVKSCQEGSCHSNDGDVDAQKTVKVPQRFKCSDCLKVFKLHHHDVFRKHRLQKHGDKTPFSCVVCTVTFSRFSALNKHNAKHAADDPIMCLLCKKRFLSDDDVMEHLKNSHQWEIGKTPNPTVDAPSSSVHSSAFHCDACNRSFNTENSLSNHKSYWKNQSALCVQKDDVTENVDGISPISQNSVKESIATESSSHRDSGISATVSIPSDDNTALALLENLLNLAVKEADKNSPSHTSNAI